LASFAGEAKTKANKAIRVVPKKNVCFFIFVFYIENGKEQFLPFVARMVAFLKQKGKPCRTAENLSNPPPSPPEPPRWRQLLKPNQNLP
jgi:hypothetical protein